MTEAGEAAPAIAADEVTAQLVRAGEVADRREVGLWFVGGALRDLLLGRPLYDVDLAVETAAANALEFATRLGALPGWRLEKSHARFGTASLRAPGGLRVDVAATRREEYPAPASLPVVTGTTTIEEDLGRRDFTINAMARRVGRRGLTGAVLDPFGGRKDLASRRLRLLHPKSLVDDPTRVYRAVKYAVRLGFSWDGEFEKALKRARAAGAFGALSGDRMRRGFEEILPGRGMGAGGAAHRRARTPGRRPSRLDRPPFTFEEEIDLSVTASASLDDAPPGARASESRSSPGSASSRR